MPKNSQIAALAVGAATATLLAAVQEMFPGLKSALPLNQSSFVQTSALILGALAISIIYDAFRGARTSEKESLDEEQDSDSIKTAWSKTSDDRNDDDHLTSL
ncbi:hypothetical protein [uncultured Roseobacter sp.]|uniref:hypothetical protein n=1 Tax=uncultured Roseobacter sp. TaxID=114847 RepID=UPI00260B9551|nr:hypothetical protein [uncultured Roseobacter sp.]